MPRPPHRPTAPSAAEFDGLVRAHTDAVLRYLLRRAPRHAEDLAQETLRIAWERRDAIHDEPLLWLYATARRVLANHLRRERTAAEGAIKLQQTQPGPTITPEDAASVRAALATLAPRDAEVLLLAYWEGLLPREIAVVLDLSPTAASKRLERAKGRFRAAWADADDAAGSRPRRRGVEIVPLVTITHPEGAPRALTIQPAAGDRDSGGTAHGTPEVNE